MSFFSTLFAVATYVAAAYFTQGMSIGYQMAATFAASMVVSRLFAPNQQSPQTQGNNTRQQVPPDPTAGIPLVYGSAYTSGRFVDGILTNDQQSMYYTMVISCISANGQFTYDTSKFYYQDQLITFDGSDLTKVVSLTDGAGNVDSTISGHLYISLFTSSATGTISPVNTSLMPSDIINTSNGIPSAQAWPSTGRQMNGTAFAIVRLVYNAGSAGTTSLQPITFHVTHALNGTGVAKPGDVWYDYLTNTVYGGAVPTSNVDLAAATALNTYSDATINYTPYGGGSASQPRYRFNGVLDTGQTVLSNLDLIMNCCDCWQGYQAATGLWTVIINQDISASFAFDDTNIIGGINVGSLDITQQSNQIEAKFNDSTNRDQAGYVNIQTPSYLLYPNEPVNKYSVSYDLVNDSVMAQYLANRTLEQARLDLVVNFSTTYAGIQVNAGDVITITNDDYGWSAKKFRVMQVKEASLPDGTLGASIQCLSYDSAVYATASITQYTPTPNSNLANPNTFGTVSAPTISNLQTTAAVPSFQVNINASSLGITEYAEVWYSPYSSATPSQLIFYGTTAVMQGGSAYPPNTALPPVTVTGLASSNWYFYTRMVNSLTKSQFSAASSVVNWRPLTFQFSKRWLAVAYANNANGTSGFSYNPRSKAYFGIYNNDTANGGTDPTLYTWYSVAAFGSVNYLLYANRQNRKFSFNVGGAGYLNLGGVFVPSDTSVYDSTQWSALIDPTGSNQSFIDLDVRTGQLTIAGSTGNNVNDGFLAVTNNTDGSMKVNLHDFLNFGAGVYSKSFSAATLTVDVYGRVVGFSEADNFYYTEDVFNATAGQTSFSITHTVGWVLVFRNGELLDPSEYTETSSTVVMNTACVVNEKVVIIYMRGNSTSEYYEPLNITIASSGSNTVTYSGLPWNQVQAGDKITFANTGSPTQYTVASVNQSTKVITFTTSISGATAGLALYRYRAASSNYAPFTRYDQDVTAITSFLPTEYKVRNGFEFIFVNGVQISEIDYNVDVTTSALNGFPAPLTGRLTVIQFTPNNLAVPASNIANTPTYSVSGQATYPFNSNPLSMEVYANGCLLTKTYDYNAYAASWVLTTPFGNNDTLLNQQTFARIGAA